MANTANMHDLSGFYVRELRGAVRCWGGACGHWLHLQQLRGWPDLQGRIVVRSGGWWAPNANLKRDWFMWKTRR